MSKRLPPLKTLHTFLVTAEHLNFTRAAEQLHLTQGAVSRQISNLEDYLGYTLFSRQARGLAMTREGEAILPGLQQAFELISTTLQPRANASDALLNIKLPTCAMRWFMPRLQRFQEHYPEQQFAVATTIDHGVQFDQENFAAAVLYCRQPPKGVEAVQLFREHMTPVCIPSLIRPTQPLQQATDLLHYPLLHPSRDQHDWRQWLLQFNGPALSPARSYQFDTLDLAINAALQGMGVTMGDRTLVEEELQRGTLITPFPDSWMETGFSYYLVYPARHRSQLQPLARWLTDR
ncbi:LysR family transcriptional regulator [Pokkaliibacter plantistimulans]|uniref:LysR family transcriptional regulator n=1 Tax=Proteobacteria bacterium 228 TaxID=2083153 RepID=A0A2S5KVK0_9PROT|nr:LysR substrate-binding domain-containing protein [Pokkaliibacter plantistimulans]PPC78874.1 LysR family transcriptional regulator [Pokkaliibacter plantistimulans]